EYKDPKLIRDIIDGVSAQKNKTNGVVKIDNDSTYSVDAEGNVFYLSGGKKTPFNKSGLPETMAVDIKNRIKALETGGSLYNIDKNGNVYEIKEGKRTPFNKTGLPSSLKEFIKNNAK